MESNIPSLEQSDLDKLNDKDKAELRQFITNEQQRTRIQARKHFFLLSLLPPHSAGYLSADLPGSLSSKRDANTTGNWQKPTP